MGRKKTHTPEEIVAKLRQVEVPAAQGKSAAEAVRAVGVTEQTYHRRRAEFGGLKLDRVRRLKELERESARLRKAVSDPTLEEAVLKEAASGRCRAPPAAGPASGARCATWASPSAGPARCRGGTDRRGARRRGRRTMRPG